MRKKACFWIETAGELTQYDDTFVKKIFAFRNDNGTKTLWEYETTSFVKKHTDSTTGANDFGRVVIGAPIIAPTENGSGACELVCCMDTALTDAEVEMIGDKLHKHYF